MFIVFFLAIKSFELLATGYIAYASTDSLLGTPTTVMGRVGWLIVFFVVWPIVIAIGKWIARIAVPDTPSQN